MSRVSIAMRVQSIRVKINASIIAACIIVALFFGVVFSSFEIQRRASRIQEIGTLMEAVYEQNREELANEIFARHTEALASTLDAITSVKGICHIAVYDLEGRIIMATGKTVQRLMAQSTRKVLNRGPSVREVSISKEAYLEYASRIEVIGERVGYIAMYYDLTGLEEEGARTGMAFLALLVTTLVVLSLVLNRILTGAVLSPMTGLRQAIQKLQLGNLGEQVSVTSKDEIGEVMCAFNDFSVMLLEQRQALDHSLKMQKQYAKELEDANRMLEHLNVRLEDMVRERTRELLAANEQLKEQIAERRRSEKARKELDDRLARSEKMEALGLLAGGVAHDLNNVLSGIVSYPDLLLMELPASSPLRKPIQVMKDSGQKAAAIVQDLLTLARRGVLQMEPLDLNREILDYLSSAEHERHLGIHKGVTVVTDLEEGLLPVMGSTIHIRKALMNLVLNAMEAMPEGGTVTLTTRNAFLEGPIEGHDDIIPGDYVVLTVRDTGVGIDPADMRRIFEPFYSKKVLGRSGTGLGMAVVWGTVQDHRGYINVKSTPEQGSSFELFFPATRMEAVESQERASQEDIAGNGELILVVDDLDTQRQIATDILTRLGYTALSAASGEEELGLLRETAVDCVLLDMIMEPGMDGLDTYRRILEINPGQKALIASGYAENERVREAIRLGASGYLKKPYTIENLGLSLKNCLAAGDGGSPA